MILVDTSVLIDFLRDRPSAATEKFERALARGMLYGITELTYLEVLQGAATPGELKSLQRYLDTMVFYVPKGRSTYAEAARLYFKCREKGITVRSSIDCLIAQIAIENHLLLLHNDADYTRIGAVIKTLEFF